MYKRINELWRIIFYIALYYMLLLNSPLIGKETYILYKSENPSGIPWKTIGDDKVQPIYIGEIKNGIPNGRGIYSFPDGRKYFGQWENGEINGLGRYISPFRWKYEGQFKEGKFHGWGIYTYPDGEVYVGEFKNGIQDGQGTLSYPDGRKYVGEFKNGIQNGLGIQTFSNGWNGIGEWIDVEPWNIEVFDKNGELKMKWENGKVQYF